MSIVRSCPDSLRLQQIELFTRRGCRVGLCWGIGPVEPGATRDGYLKVARSYPGGSPLLRTEQLYFGPAGICGDRPLALPLSHYNMLSHTPKPARLVKLSV